MTGFWTKEDEEYWSKPENRLLFEFDRLWTSKDYWERTPENAKRRDEDLRKLFRDFFEKEKLLFKEGAIMKYKPHSDNGEELKIELVENGLLITYQHLLTTKKVFVATLKELNDFFANYYKEQQ